MSIKKYEKKMIEMFENHSLIKDFTIGIMAAALMYDVWRCDSFVQKIVISAMFALIIAWVFFWLDEGCVQRMKYKARETAGFVPEQEQPKTDKKETEDAKKDGIDPRSSTDRPARVQI